MFHWIVELADALGILGVGLILMAYILMQLRRIVGTGVLFSLMNCIGAALILFSLLFNWNTPAALMEGTWMLVSLWGTLKALHQTRKFSSSRKNKGH